MRTPIALAIYVSVLTVTSPAGSFAEGPVSTANWSTVYDAGLAANQHHSYEESLGLFQRSWEASRTAEERGVSATSLGQTWRQLDHPKEARVWLERARQAFSTDPRLGSRLAVSAADLADLYRATGDYPGAERLLREMVVSPSCDAESKALLRNNLADLLREEGRSTEAEPLFEDSVGLDAVSWKQRFAALIGLADIARQRGDWEASVDHWNEALRICRRERNEGAEAVALHGLGTTWLKAGEPGRAEPLLRRALWIMENDPGMPPEQLAGAHSGLAELYRSENKLALAEDEWSRALRIDRTALGDAHPQVAILMEMLSDVYSARGEFSLAREYATRASETMSVSFGENSMALAAALTNRATVEERASDLGAAAKDYERAIDIARVHPEHRSLQVVMIQRYAGLLKAMHRPREAKALDMEARSFQAK
jgi:tetratricopeptide (TPR) repeat protein